MRMQVRFEGGRKAEAVLLAGNRHEMRVAVEGLADTQHWNRFDAVWLDEMGEPIEIEAVMVVEGTDWLGFCGEMGAATMRIGG